MEDPTPSVNGSVTMHGATSSPPAIEELLLMNGIKRSWRLAGALAILVMLTSQVAMSEPGRDYPRCIHQCNEIRRACRNNCAPSCAAIFPPGAARDACVSACKDSCIRNSNDCKDVCRAIKDGETPEDP